jgi:hypothetical protein
MLETKLFQNLIAGVQLRVIKIFQHVIIIEIGNFSTLHKHSSDISLVIISSIAHLSNQEEHNTTAQAIITEKNKATRKLYV